ncbi:MAG: hypothetical protein SVM80_08520 [Halobacteriota archaeon]|nr:hypothetical protein [Halobacteriota archaeon]
MLDGHYENKVYPIHFVLFISGIFTFGFLDGFTALLMMNKYGVIAEFNPLFRHIALNYGGSALLFFKVTAVFMVLSVPLLLQAYSKESMYWTTTGFLGVFTVSGVVAAFDNFMLLQSGKTYIDPRLVLGTTFIFVVLAIYVGDAADQHKNRGIRFKISDEEWSRMKYDMGYPRLRGKPLISNFLNNTSLTPYP